MNKIKLKSIHDKMKRIGHYRFFEKNSQTWGGLSEKLAIRSGLKLQAVSFEIKVKRREAKKSGITAMASLRGGSRAIQVFSVLA